MRTLVKIGSLVAAAALFTLGCGKDEEKLATVDLFCAALATGECQVASLCVLPPADCKAARKTACLAFAAATMSAARPYQPDQAPDCVKATEETYAKPLITAEDLAALRQTCEHVFSGAKKSLEACTSTHECSGKMICDKNRCAERVEKKLGDLCGNPGEVCEKGGFCDNVMGAFQCAMKLGAGQPCGAKPCLESLRCVAGACAEREAPGASCASSDDCGPTASYCDHDFNSKCTRGLAFAPGAAACKSYGGSGGGPGNDGATDGGTGGGPDGGSDAATDTGASDGTSN